MKARRPSTTWTTEDVATPVGILRVTYQGRSVRSLNFIRETTTGPFFGSKTWKRHPDYPAGSPPRQIIEYFSGQRRAFDFSPELTGASEFDRKVWAAMCAIPFGKTQTYGELAQEVGRPGAARAVGGSMHRNPIALMMPCHRVVGSNGSLTGFGPGLAKKEWLLRHEGSLP